MGGLTINCGGFLADDKAGSAFERVLSDLPDFDEQLRRDILAGFDDDESTLIEWSVAARMIAPLATYRSRLVQEIGHADWFEEIKREEVPGVDKVNLQWGEGRGWRLYCAANLLAACEHSARTSEPVVICPG